MPPQRVTRPTLLILDFLLTKYRDGSDTWGFEISSATGLKGGTVYPVLSRLEGDGWVTTHWDETDRAGPRRRMYRLTSPGVGETVRVLNERAERLEGLAWRPA